MDSDVNDEYNWSNIDNNHEFNEVQLTGKSYLTKMQATNVNCSYEFSCSMMLSGDSINSKSLFLIWSLSGSESEGPAFDLNTFLFLLA